MVKLYITIIFEHNRTFIKKYNHENQEIKNLRYYSEMSQETNAFTCDLFVDGKKIGYCKMMVAVVVPIITHSRVKRDILLSAEEYAKTLPDIEYEFNNGKHYIKSLKI